VSVRRASLRVVRTHEEKAKDNGKFLPLVQNYKVKVEKELEGLCGDVVGLLEGSLIQKATETEGRAFYMKMKGDYYRYMAECTYGDAKATAAHKAATAYQEATSYARENLKATHPIRLGLILNYSVFLYEVEEKHKDACDLAKKAFDAAISELDALTEDERYKDATLIMQLLKDNVALWESEDPDNASFQQPAPTKGKKK